MNAEKVVTKLKAIAETLFTQFSQNESKANLGKCHVLSSTFETLELQKLNIVIQHYRISSNKRQRRLLNFETLLNFKFYVALITGRR